MGDTSQHTCQNQETSQELRMLSSVTINCQATMIVMNSGSQMSEFKPVSQMPCLQGCHCNCPNCEKKIRKKLQTLSQKMK